MKTILKDGVVVAKKDKKADASPTQDVAIREENYAKPDRKDGHPWRGTGKGNPKHSTLQKKCKAKNSRDEPCGLPPMRGQEVCGSHGGRNPQAEANARERMNALADPAVYVMGQIMEHSEDDATRLRAATAIVDRNGMAPRHTLAVAQEVPKYEQIMTEIARVPSERMQEKYAQLQDDMHDDRY